MEGIRERDRERERGKESIEKILIEDTSMPFFPCYQESCAVYTNTVYGIYK